VFFQAIAFNSDVSTWSMGAVTNMQQMFHFAIVFNSDISKWKTGAVTTMQQMFRYAVLFDSDVSKWNTGAVTTMQQMFHQATAFNSDVSKWNTGAVTTMQQMFHQATAFNSDVSKWNTDAVTNMQQSKCNCAIFFSSSLVLGRCHASVVGFQYVNSVLIWSILTRSVYFCLFGIWNGTFLLLLWVFVVFSFFFLVAPSLAVFSLETTVNVFNSDVSKWNTGVVTNMNLSKCTLSPNIRGCLYIR